MTNPMFDSSRTTTFSAKKNGFKFRNQNTSWRFGPFSGRFLCGGISYASLDYYNSNRPVPLVLIPPNPGTPLNDYLLSRQIDAHKFAIPSLVSSSVGSDENLFTSGVRRTENFGIVVDKINDNIPIPIVLVAINNPVSTSSHWVVVTGYGMNESPPDFGGWQCKRLEIYDSNYPNKTSYLEPDLRRHIFLHSEGGSYRSYLPYSAFASKNLNLPRYRPLFGLPPIHRRPNQLSEPFF